MPNKAPLPDHATHYAINRHTGLYLPVCFVDGLMYYYVGDCQPLQVLSHEDWYIPHKHFWLKMFVFILVIIVVAANSFG